MTQPQIPFLNALSLHQQIRINKVYSENYYVLDHSITEEKISIKISGSTKSVYTLSVLTSDRNNGKIWCDCPDNKSHAAKQNCLCKHCCFMILKIGKWTDDESAIVNKYLSLNQQEVLKTRLNRINRRTISSDVDNLNPNELSLYEEQHLVDNQLRAKFLQVNLSSSRVLNEESLALQQEVKQEEKQEVEKPKDQFSICHKSISEEDECPICYDSLLQGEVKSCPSCYNSIHADCIRKWLETRSTCVLCRSDVWRLFEKPEQDISTLGTKRERKQKSSEYLQL